MTDSDVLDRLAEIYEANIAELGRMTNRSYEDAVILAIAIRNGVTEREVREIAARLLAGLPDGVDTATGRKDVNGGANAGHCGGPICRV